MQTKVELYTLVGTSFPIPFWLPVHSGTINDLTALQVRACIYTMDTPPPPTLRAVAEAEMPAGISGGLPGSVDAKHSHKTGFDMDLHTLMCGHYLAGFMLAVTEWYQTLLACS